jgi:hypothetical protein
LGNVWYAFTSRRSILHCWTWSYSCHTAICISQLARKSGYTCVHVHIDVEVCYHLICTMLFLTYIEILID